MYNNIGSKIKLLAKIVFYAEAAIIVLIGLILLVEDDDFIVISLPMMFGGPAIAWVSSWILYGFGELIDKTCDIARNTCPNAEKAEPQSKGDYERIRKIENLRNQGLITEEEYQKTISKNQMEV